MIEEKNNEHEKFETSFQQCLIKRKNCDLEINFFKENDKNDFTKKENISIMKEVLNIMDHIEKRKIILGMVAVLQCYGGLKHGFIFKNYKNIDEFFNYPHVYSFSIHSWNKKTTKSNDEFVENILNSLSSSFLNEGFFGVLGIGSSNIFKDLKYQIKIHGICKNIIESFTPEEMIYYMHVLNNPPNIFNMYSENINKYTKHFNDYPTSRNLLRCNKCNKILITKEETLRCSQCSRSFYCSKECQKEDWKNHKPICKILYNFNHNKDLSN